MKNVLARGGIEFIAVFLGIALSLWVDEYRENNEIQRLNNSILNRLYDNLESDSTNFTWVINAHKTSLKSCNSINKWIDSSQNIHDSVNIHISRVAINTFTWANKEEYSSLKTSGRLDLIKNEELVKTLHEYYSQIEFAQKVEDDLNSDWIQIEFIPFIAEYSIYFGNPIKVYIDTTTLSLYYILCLKQIKSSILLVEKLKQVMVPYLFTMDYLL